MKRPTFFEGVVVAIAASVGGGVVYTLFGVPLPEGLVLRLLIAGLGLCYVLYLLNRSGVRIGRITTIAAWTLVAGAIAFLKPALGPYLLWHVGALWLIRSLYFHHSLLSALADLVLHAFSVIVVIWALGQTGSVSLGIWCFFLVQALFPAIPPALPRKQSGQGEPEDRFHQAYRAAESALRQLTSIH